MRPERQRSTPPRRVVRNRAGLALPMAIFVMVILGLLITWTFTMTSLDAKASRNREDAARALHVAEAGLAHVLALGRGPLANEPLGRLLIGSDNTPNTADDGRLLGYGLPAGDEIPATGRTFGGGTYFARVLDDPADPDPDALIDGNNQVLVRCWSTMPDGAGAEVHVIVRSSPSLPAIAVEGNLEISSAAEISGACGGIHANGNLTGGGHPSVSTQASATGSVSLDVSPRQSGAAPLAIPDMNPASYCPPGGITITNANWNPSPSALVAGNTYCASGDVILSSDFGSLTSMRPVSIIAGGSIKVAAKPFLRAAHPDGIVLLAGGDVDIQGDAGFEGMVYAGGQCYLSSQPTIVGQLLCKNKSPHAGTNWVPAHLISGAIDVINDCSAGSMPRFQVTAWYPAVAM